MTRAIIDADLYAYRCAASLEPTKTKPFREELGLGIARLRDLHERVLREVEATSYIAYIGGQGNFRKDICPDYKAHRKEMTLPLYLNEIKEYMICELGAKVTDGYEADDAIGIEHQRCMDGGIDCVVVSIDKDLLQLEGNHYNFVRSEKIEITKLEAAYNLYALMLTGDKADNIIGVTGIGVKKSFDALKGLTEEEMYLRVKELYDDDERFNLNLRLFTVMKNEEELQEIYASLNKS